MLQQTQQQVKALVVCGVGGVKPPKSIPTYQKVSNNVLEGSAICLTIKDVVDFAIQDADKPF